MTRKKKLFLNSTSSLLYQLIKLLCGFILPRMFLLYYGSAVNGLVSSITHFLGFITLAECGVGAVVQSTLYKPLAEKNDYEISRIIISSERFFKKIAYLLAAYTIVLMIVYPLITLESFDYFFTAVLIFAISINSFAEYYIGVSYQLLLGADQLGFVRYMINIVATIVNTIACIIFMMQGASIQVVKLVTSLIFMLQPLTMSWICKKRYVLDRTIVLTEEPIKQKWNGFAQHVAAVVLSNTDTVVLTMLSTLENVSIYGVYALVVNGIKGVLLSLTNGVQALFGNMLAKKETGKLLETFGFFEWVMHAGVTFTFGVTVVTLVPFVSVYTRGITDADYIVPLFGFLLTISQAVYCIRLPYISMVYAAGHYKQTQFAAVMEAIINIIVSVICVFQWGLVGVAIGTLAAMSYRTLDFVVYLSKNILYRNFRYFVKHVTVDALNLFILLMIVNCLPNFFGLRVQSYPAWILLAVKVSVTELVVTLLVNLIFFKQKLFYALVMLKQK